MDKLTSEEALKIEDRAFSRMLHKDITPKIVRVINNDDFNFCHDPSSLNPHGHFAGVGGTIALHCVSGNKPHAIIETSDYDIYVYWYAGDFVFKIIMDGKPEDPPYTIIHCDKTFHNTASAECLVYAAQEELRIAKFSAIFYTESRIAIRRKAAGYTLDELSLLSGVHAMSISRLERRERYPENCTFATIKKLADVLQCRTTDIV